MVAYPLAAGIDRIFDPAVGSGAFFRAAKAVASMLGRDVELAGTELYPKILDEARASGLTDEDLSRVEIGDFPLRPLQDRLPAVVANPPYIRHHRLAPDLKQYLRGLSANILRFEIDGRAGLHVYFFVTAFALLERGGRLAFIMPADTCEGVFAPALWRWIAERYRIDAVVAFAPECTPFPGVDTNAVVFFIRNDAPDNELRWARCAKRRDELLRWVLEGFPSSFPGLEIHRGELREALATSLSRPPRIEDPDTIPLRELVEIRRGIATGANEFFFLTRSRAVELGIPQEFLVPAVGRTRDVPGELITLQTLDDLDRAGWLTLLLSLDGRLVEEFPETVREYIRIGEKLGLLPDRALLRTRRPWPRMETRTPPPFLFAYLGRRNTRFIRNLAGVVPLTGFLCVYPRNTDPCWIDCLWDILRSTAVLEHLPWVGKSYGDGAIKVEPRSLERLPIPRRLLSELRSLNLAA